MGMSLQGCSARRPASGSNAALRSCLGPKESSRAHRPPLPPAGPPLSPLGRCICLPSPHAGLQSGRQLRWQVRAGDMHAQADMDFVTPAGQAPADALLAEAEALKAVTEVLEHLPETSASYEIRLSHRSILDASLSLIGISRVMSIAKLMQDSPPHGSACASFSGLALQLVHGGAVQDALKQHASCGSSSSSRVSMAHISVSECIAEATLPPPGFTI